MGKYLQDNGIKNVYLMAPNYQAGKDMLAEWSDIIRAAFPERFSPNSDRRISRLKSLP